ncbi:MAG: prolipoprotein diacylglyceryl transferase family protein [Bacteroidota bacterium]
MYPDLSYILHDLIGTDVDNAFSIVKTFGLLLAIAILTSAYFLNLELKRKEAEGLLGATRVKTTIGEPASVGELVINAIFGFLLGFKVVHIALNFSEFQADAPGFLFSSKGNVIAGILGAVVLAGLKYWEKDKQKLAKPKIEETLVRPSDRIGDITLIAAFTGILGAKFFAIFEDMSNLTVDNFFQALLSGGGLAIYGGLIGGFCGVVWYLKKHKINVSHVADAVAPALIIGYGVGRIGCQLSGDGDWGIDNLAAAPSWWFLPEWLWAYDYPQNVLNQGVPIEGCVGNYCRALANPVYPTPVYETVMAFAIAGILWALRKRLPVPGMLFCVYLILNGFERFWIEKIRVNSEYDIFGFTPTQAEVIAVLLFVIGSVGYLILQKRGTALFN